ncbi:MAG: PcfB family protein [Oscillospiraceae bacterium]|nr:PcfB family protein [Oscillospiraceae bacterium]
MQEELENRSVTLIISGGKLTGRVLKTAVARFLAWQKSVKQKKEAMQDVKPQGKQTVKQLVGQNQGVANIEITDRNIRSFDYIARKYGVDYAVKKDRSVSPPKYLVFFKARDADALTAAFTEYSRKAVRKAERPSVLAKMRELASQVLEPPADRVRNKDKELER